ncbi:MAG: DNA methyltransferase [Limisphaerales bacterium]
MRALANLWVRQGNYPRAEHPLRLALALEPADANALNNMGVVCSETGRKDEATRLFRESLRNDPGPPNPYVGLARELARAHRCEEALSVVGDLFAKAKRPGPELDDSPAKHQESQADFMPRRMNCRLEAENCLGRMQELAAESVDVVVTSPPYNLGVDYGTYKDDLPEDQYLRWSRQWMGEVFRVLKAKGSFFWERTWPGPVS